MKRLRRVRVAPLSDLALRNGETLRAVFVLEWRWRVRERPMQTAVHA